MTDRPPSRNAIRRAKKLSNFDPDTPRCGTCKSKRMRSDRSIHGPIPWCDWHGFMLPNGGMGLCDDWRGKDGSTLEKENPVKDDK